MRAWQLPAGSDSFGTLTLADLPDLAPGPGEVLFAPKAWSINYRDFAVAAGKYFGGVLKAPTIPLSDAAGEVLAVGEGVSDFAPGDRVQSSFFLDWLDGPQVMGRALGDGMAPGMLAEKVVLPASGVVKCAESLSFAEAACMPCAGVTAWNALVKGGRPVGTGSRVLVLGSGGVSLIALALARALGAEVIATSSSDEKLARVMALGATHGVNYKTVPEWGAHVAKAFGGAHKVVEVGGVGTLQQSMNALASEGEVALIGVLADGEPPHPRQLMMMGGSIRGIFVGSVAMARELNAFVDSHGVKPTIGANFGFAEAPAAYAHAWGPESFGKTVITLD